jgi:hypothetical protein
MANQETQLLDDIIVSSRRKMLSLGAASLAGLMLASSTRSAKAAATYTDNDILNFALNLEYLEANFYYLAAFGCTIDKPNDAAKAAGAPTAGIPITISGGGVGTAGTVTGGSQVPFATVQVGSYATETAIEEGKHVLALQNALSTAAVNQPQINLAGGTGGSFGELAQAATITTDQSFTPYASDATFLVGAYVFEDVGVTAYHGAASLLTGTNTTLPVAAGILAVEAYHAGLVRTTLNYLDPDGSKGLVGYTTKISALRASLSNAALLGATPAASAYDNQPDDYGLAPAIFTLPTGSVTGTRLVDADPTDVVAFARNTTQVLNIVTGGGAVKSGAVVSPATGIFFPAGLNAGANGFK